MELSIKQLRRIEVELLSEKDHLVQRLNSLNHESSPTKDCAKVTGEAQLASCIESVTALIDARYCIRKIISDFNESAGINDKTLRIALLEDTREARAELLASLGSIRPITEYNSKDVKYTYGIGDDYEDHQRALDRLCKRQIQSLKDSCNGINSSSKVTIPDTLKVLITKYELVDV